MRTKNDMDYEFKTGLHTFRTPVEFDVCCNDGRILQALRGLGAEIKYTTERTVYFFLDGIHLTLGHNWSGQRNVVAQPTGLGLKIGHQTERKVKYAVENALSEKTRVRVLSVNCKQKEDTKEYNLA